MVTHRTDKLIMLRAIYDRRSTLFGKPSAKLTAEDKHNAWEEVRRVAIQNGASSFTDRNWKHLRDKIWWYLKQTTLVKYTNAQKMGIETVVYNEMEKMVLAILGIDTPPTDIDESLQASTLTEPESTNDFVATLSPLETPALELKPDAIDLLQLLQNTKPSKRSRQLVEPIRQMDETETKRIKFEMLEEQLTGARLDNQLKEKQLMTIALDNRLKEIQVLRAERESSSLLIDQSSEADKLASQYLQILNNTLTPENIAEGLISSVENGDVEELRTTLEFAKQTPERQLAIMCSKPLCNLLLTNTELFIRVYKKLSFDE
ncbi:hypothetical protein M3Y95_01098000 [Aphelenchoides besseyi]|nr:hypothetical protein M3Y95_01098000 [Aphelenchoides besseyi]